MIRRVLLAALVAALLPAWAWAHAQLRGAEPAAGSVVAAAPAEVVLTFNEPVAPLQARLFAPDGGARDLEGRASGPRLIVALPGDLGPGTHALSWRVVSDDGHPLGGTHVFSIGHATGPPAAVPAPLPWPAALARGALTLALAFGLGGMVWAVLSQTVAPRPIRRALWAVPPSALVLMAAQAMDLSGSGAAALADPAAWGLALASPFALTAGLAVLAAGLALGGGRAAVLAGWGLAAASFAAAGHAARAEPVALMAPLMAAHALALIFWAGALPGLVAALPRSDAAALMARFSRLALPMVALLALSGAGLAVRQVETPAALTGTAYGRLLLVKLALVAAVLALAARHRLILTPRLARDPARARPAFARSLRLELALMVLILALTAGFRLTPPPRALAEAPETRAELHLHGRETMADIALVPGRPGPNRVEIVPMDGDFQPLMPRAITLTFARPAEGLEPIELPAAPGPDGIWRAGPVHLPPGGPLEVVVEILITDFRMERIGGTVALGP